MNTRKSLTRGTITAALIAANLFVLTFYISGWSNVISQANKEKTVVRERPQNNEPIEIVDFQVKGKAISSDENFQGESDWLKSITFKVKNKSKSPVTYSRIDIDFPETATTGNILLHQLYLGRRSEYSSTLKNQQLHLMPTESLDVALVTQYEQIRMLVEGRHSSIENINKIVIRLGEVMFDDGTLYSGGSLFKRNPDANSPRKWVIVNK